ncbi:hypothetical protein [Actinoplanes sp. URMC 104]|uniref:hypothetical protein n=1 Tax=Actinoplanes sp. URMC 104 TaxID=3423409 RepID=UPI003F198985
MTKFQTLTRILIAVGAALVSVLAAALVATPAEAAGRMFIHHNGLCVREVSQDPQLKACSQTPVNYRNWSFIGLSSYNGHQVYRFKNIATGRCVNSFGSGGGPASFVCNNQIGYGGDEWEVFNVGSGTSRRQVLKNLYTYFEDGKHECIQYVSDPAYSSNLIQAPCNLNNKAQWFRLF